MVEIYQSCLKPLLVEINSKTIKKSRNQEIKKSRNQDNQTNQEKTNQEETNQEKTNPEEEDAKDNYIIRKSYNINVLYYL